MTINCKWLPKENTLDLNEFEKEIDKAYEEFEHDFIKSFPIFDGLPVRVRRYPEDELKHRYSAFNHITTRDYNHINGKNSSNYDNREPDIRRIERITWVRKLIEHPNCRPQEICNCKGTFAWFVDYKGKKRANILHYTEMFMVVLEKRKDFYLLVTSFLLNNKVVRDQKYKEYKKSNSKYALSKAKDGTEAPS